MWGEVAALGLNILSSWGQATLQKAQYDAQHTLNEANAYSQNLVNTTNATAANDVRTANNGFQAAMASLANTQRSVSNQTKMTNFGVQWNALETNQARIIDGMVRGSLSTRLKAASTLGAIQAQAAARGVGGSSAAALRSVASLAAGNAITQQDENQKYVTYDALIQKAGLIRTAVTSLDMGQTLPQLDYSTNVAPLAQAPINPGDFISPLRAGITSALGNNATGIATLLNGLGGSSKLLDGAGGSFVPVANNSALDLGASVGSSADFAGTSEYFNMA